jgi:large subunit ribosomal protein L9
MVEVILLERIESLGTMGSVVKVRPGFARNYLLPQKKALRATKQNLAVFESRKAELQAASDAKKAEASVLAKKVDGVTVAVIRSAGDNGHLYGSVSNRDVAEALQAKGFTAIDRQMVQIDQPIKMLGLFTLRVRLHPEVSVSVTVNVARTQDEAIQQEKTGKSAAAGQQSQEVEAAAEIPGTGPQPEVA